MYRGGAGRPQSIPTTLTALYTVLITGETGAFLVTYPRDRIKSLLFIGWFARVTFVPAALLIGLWFVIQLFNAGAVANVNTGGVAYLAHMAA
jgi:membrane associated rhomboid family serine protease